MLDFSIIVPSYGRPDNVPGLLASLARLNYESSRFEVIVVDDGSPTPLSSVLSLPKIHLDLTVLKQRNSGPAAARNYGADIARGRCLLFTDDDCRPQPGWLQSMADVLGESDRLLCGGKTINGLKDNIYSEASQLLSDHLLKHYSPITTYGGFFPTNNLAVSKNSFWDAGGFDTSLRFGEDRDFCYRCASLGFSFAYAPGAVVYHNHPQTLFSFILLHSRYGGGTYAFRRGCIAKGLPRVCISPLSWYINLILTGIRNTRTVRGVSLSFLLLASQIAVLTGMMRGALTHRLD
jgi:glycosyltransferase involved in cell wall biosynthesis